MDLVGGTEPVTCPQQVSPRADPDQPPAADDGDVVHLLVEHALQHDEDDVVGSHRHDAAAEAVGQRALLVGSGLFILRRQGGERAEQLVHERLVALQLRTQLGGALLRLFEIRALPLKQETIDKWLGGNLARLLNVA